MIFNSSIGKDHLRIALSVQQEPANKKPTSENQLSLFAFSSHNLPLQYRSDVK